MGQRLLTATVKVWRAG